MSELNKFHSTSSILVITGVIIIFIVINPRSFIRISYNVGGYLLFSVLVAYILYNMILFKYEELLKERAEEITRFYEEMERSERIDLGEDTWA